MYIWAVKFMVLSDEPSGAPIDVTTELKNLILDESRSAVIVSVVIDALDQFD